MRLVASKRAAAILCLGVILSSCTPKGTNEAWCTGYRDVILAGTAADSAVPGSAEFEAAAVEMNRAFEALAVASIPEEIEADFELLKSGPDVADAGEAFYAAGERVGEWSLDNCDYPADFIELFEEEAR